jgi:hypothetical protein
MMANAGPNMECVLCIFILNRSHLMELLKKTPCLWSASELCRPSDRRFLAEYYQLLRIEGVAWSAQRIPLRSYSRFS